jgi:TRAP-type mannitol/chloroaromatic compound transport system permease small subunit
MKGINRLLTTIDAVITTVGKLASLILLLVIAVVIYEVVMRDILRLPTTWAMEMSQFLFGSSFALAGAYTLLNKGHVRMDVIYAKLSAKGQAIMDIITSIFMIIFLGVLIWKGGEYALRSIRLMDRSMSAWAPLFWPTKIMIPISASLLLLQALAQLVRDIITIIGNKTGGC